MTQSEIFSSIVQPPRVGGFEPSVRSYKPSFKNQAVSTREEGTFSSPISPDTLKPSRPDQEKIAAVAPIFKSPSMDRSKALDEIARLAGKKPEAWEKPKFGDFEYWLAHNCGWISDAELAEDTAKFETKRRIALETSHRFSSNRFSWTEKPRYEEPKDTGEYIPEVSMKLIKDRNLTDSARRIALFVMRHVYQHRRSERLIGMIVSFIMKGLSLSRRTVQRSLTLLETRGYFRCDVVTGDKTKMCIGLTIRLLGPLFPKHHKEKWPERRRNSGASIMPHNKSPIHSVIDNPRRVVFRMTWAIKSMAGVARSAYKAEPTFTQTHVQNTADSKSLALRCPCF